MQEDLLQKYALDVESELDWMIPVELLLKHRSDGKKRELLFFVPISPLCICA